MAAERNLVACKSYIESLSFRPKPGKPSSPCRSYSAFLCPDPKGPRLSINSGMLNALSDWKPFTTILYAGYDKVQLDFGFAGLGVLYGYGL